MTSTTTTMNNNNNRKDMHTKPIYQPMRKSCQFCRRRKIKCIIERDKNKCKACTTRDQDCIFARKGTIDDYSPPPPSLIPQYRGRSLPSGHADHLAAHVPANPDGPSGASTYPSYHEQASYTAANSTTTRFQPSYRAPPVMQAAARPSRVKTLPIRREALPSSATSTRAQPYPSNRLYSTPQQRSISVPTIPTLRYPQAYAGTNYQHGQASYYATATTDQVYAGQPQPTQYQYVPATASSWIYRGQGGLEPHYEAGAYPSYEYYSHGAGQPAYSNERGGGFEVFATPPQASASVHMANESLAPGWQMTPHSLYNETLSATPSVKNEDTSLTPSDNSPAGSVRLSEHHQTGSSSSQVYHSSETASGPSYYQTASEQPSPSGGYLYVGEPQDSSSTMYGQAANHHHHDPTLHYYQAQSPVGPEHSSFYPLDGMSQPHASGSGIRYQQEEPSQLLESHTSSPL